MPSRAYGHTDGRNGSHGRVAAQGGTPMHNTRRAWTDNGVHYTMETSSFSRPGISFGMMSGSANGSLNGFVNSSGHHHPPGFTVGNGLLGSALGLLGGLMSPPAPATSRRPIRQTYVEEASSDDEDMDDDLNSEEEDTGRSQSMFSRFKDKVRDNQQRDGAAPYARDISSARRPRTNVRHNSFQTEVREPSWAESESAPYETVDEEDYTENDRSRRRPRLSRNSSSKHDTIGALENAVHHHAKEIRRCKKQLQQASQHSGIGSNHLQEYLNRLKWHEVAYDNALRDLQTAKAELNEGARPNRRVPPPTQPGPSHSARAAPMPAHDGFQDPFFGTPLGFMPRQRAATHPFFAEPEGFDPFPGNIFNTFNTFERVFHNFGTASPLYDDFEHFFAMPGMTFTNAQSKRPRYSTRSSGTQPQHNPMRKPAAPPMPPPSLLKPEEAKRIFKTYNDRWLALSPIDPDIPFPCRGLYSAGLVDHSTIWAPLVNTHPSTWSQETIMQANTQAFFLGVVNMSPQYTEIGNTGRIQMGFDKARASPAHVQQLIELLKKEKTRWHSDRLGRRNNGNTGPNEALQQNEQARAVFHAVCELMEVAQSNAGSR